ncbi:MAG: retron system putative HNH endonuclease [Candidatus Parabeggiatoa sp.]|nr:retron system putative HNH endonuclease [Candidatus Parabeggiatoa sp.]
MKYILKGAEPPFFTDWKNNDKMYQRGRPNWKRLKSKEKQALHKALLEDQGEICCYCGRRIVLDDSHVEHFRPQKGYPKLQLEYENLLSSCQLELQKTEPRHCGNAKGSWFDEEQTVSPLDPSCESRFEYLEDGSLRAYDNNDEGVKATITHLALDIEKLRELRQAAISAALEEIDILDEKAIQEEIALYSQHNPVNQQFTPFCSAIVSVLSSLMTRIDI